MVGFLREKTAIQRVVPGYAVPGGRVMIMGSGFNGRLGNAACLDVNGSAAPISCARSKMLTITIPEEITPGVAHMVIGGEAFENVGLRIAAVLARDVHPVDNPVVGADGHVYTTLSGPRGEKTAVSVFRISPEGSCESYLSDIMNPTSLAFGPDGALYISSRFTGSVYRVGSPTDVSVYAEGLGTATGIVFDRRGNLLVGDRCGTIFCVGPDRKVVPLVSIPPSVAAFHLCIGPDDSLYITNPDISTYDAVLRVAPDASEAEVFYPGIKRPQGMAFDSEGNLYVAKAMAGDSGIIKISPRGQATMIVSGPVLVGLALDQSGNMYLAGTSMIYMLPIGAKALHSALT